MDQTDWKNQIKQNCVDCGTYKESFEAVIDTLAEILSQRDSCLEEYVANGSQPLLEHTNQGGNTNFVKNPLLVMWADFNTTALAYWRELGLTPSSLRKLNESALNTIKESALDKVLREFG